LLNNLERQIRLSKEIFKITNNKLDFDLLSKLNKVEVEKYHLLLQQSLNTFPLDKQKRFFDRMNQMDELMMKEYINKPQKYIDNFEVGGKYNMVIFEEKVRE